MSKIVVVKKGDTLSKIAKDNNTTVSELVRINNIKNPNLIHINQNIEVPGNDTMDFSQYLKTVKPVKDSDPIISNTNNNSNKNNDLNVIDLVSRKVKNVVLNNSNNNATQRLDSLSKSLPNSASFYAGGRCGVLARETLETLGVIEKGFRANGVDYARNLAHHPEAAKQGYTIKGYEVNGNKEEVFDSILKENNGNLSNLVISFNSKGHYRKSGQFGHVITVTDIKDNKVYLMDTYDTRNNRWKRGTTPMTMDLEEFKSTYLYSGNSINYITHIKKDNKTT